MFYRLQLIEAYGTGISKIMKAYEGMKEKPLIETTKNAFKIILPNVNAKYETGETSLLREAPAVSFDVRAEKVLEYAISHGAITRNDVTKLLDVSVSTASRVIRELVKSNLLKQSGKARNTRYTIVK